MYNGVHKRDYLLIIFANASAISIPFSWKEKQTGEKQKEEFTQARADEKYLPFFYRICFAYYLIFLYSGFF